ncbi:MAG: hypothetical protein P8Y97_22060, partial [Candidatus Lokiarchaeota archaeon]
MTYEKDLQELESNPFKIVYPKTISPKMFLKLFSKEYTWINKLKEREDIFIKGSRGSGKTTLLYYFNIEILKHMYNSIDDFLDDKINKDNQIIGIYLDGKTDFEQGNSNYFYTQIDDIRFRNLKKNLCKQDIFYTLVRKILISLNKNFNSILKNKQISEKIRSDMNFFLENYLKIEIDFENKNEIKFSELVNLINEKLIQRIQFNIEGYLNLFYKGEITEKPGFSHSLDLTKINDFIILIKRILPEISNFSFFILLDDGDRLIKNYQEVFNLLIKPRDHDNYCLKIVLEKGWEEWKYSYSQSNHIQTPHDYDIIDLNELYSNNLRIYSKQVKKISRKRLNLLTDEEIPLEDFFPYSTSQIRIRKKFRKSYYQELLERYGYTEK